MQRIVIIIIVFFAFLLSAACTPVVKNPTPTTYPGIQATYPYTEGEYRLQVGDQIEIKFLYNAELNEQATVRPDGRITLQLVHDIMAAGLTPAELTAVLTEKYTPELKRPEIVVIVRLFVQKIYVDGEVTKAGMFPLVGFMTVLQAISQAGGVKDTARTTEVIVIRRGADNKPLVLTANLNKAIDGTDMSQDIVLRPFDIVYVPKSHIANVNIWVDQYIRKNIPIYISTGFFYTP